MTMPTTTPTTRRSVLSRMALAPIAASGMLAGGGAWRAEAATASGLVGSITGNDPLTYLRFATFLGRKQPIALLGFDQRSPTFLKNSISWICAQGALFMAKGATVLWSVPFPGGRQLENVVAGSFDATYRTLFLSILKTTPGSSNILVRLPWEFNLPSQENSAMDRTGAWNAPLWVAAYNRLAWIAKGLSSRFLLIWCPNVTTLGIDPLACWPGRETVDIIAQDFYMSRIYNQPGSFNWFLNEHRGLAWGARAAQYYGKPYAFSEWGMDSDTFLADFQAASKWLKSLGSLVHHHCWWDRPEVFDCRISDGTHPKLAAAYKAQFA